MSIDTRTTPSLSQIMANLAKANKVASAVAAQGKHPFGAVLIGPDHSTVLLEQGNINTVNHAEATLARRASELFSPEQLWETTLYTTVEPCAMCSGTQYWANIGRVVYGMSEAALLICTGNHEENPTMSLPCRQVFAHGQKPIDVIGPVAEMADDIAAIHLDFWKQH